MSAAVELSVRAPQSVNGLADFLPNNFADFCSFQLEDSLQCFYQFHKQCLSNTVYVPTGIFTLPHRCINIQVTYKYTMHVLRRKVLY
jgi:hypothetical protein